MDDSRERPLPNLLPYLDTEQTGSTDRDSSVPGEPRRRMGKQQQTSSYWRVNEMEMFPKHLLNFGKNWSKIAEEMGSKTAQQVPPTSPITHIRLKTITPKMQKR